MKRFVMLMCVAVGVGCSPSVALSALTPHGDADGPNFGAILLAPVTVLVASCLGAYVILRACHGVRLTAGQVGRGTAVAAAIAIYTLLLATLAILRVDGAGAHILLATTPGAALLIALSSAGGLVGASWADSRSRRPHGPDLQQQPSGPYQGGGEDTSSGSRPSGNGSGRLK